MGPSGSLWAISCRRSCTLSPRAADTSTVRSNGYMASSSGLIWASVSRSTASILLITSHTGHPADWSISAVALSDSSIGVVGSAMNRMRSIP